MNHKVIGGPLGTPLGGLRFDSVADVQAWADKHGGELGVRVALAEGKFYASAEMAQRWVDLQEHQRTSDLAAKTLEADRRSAGAAERAARYAMWSAAVSALASLGSAVWTLFGERIAKWVAALAG